MAQYLYVYNTDTAKVVESHDVTLLDRADREMQKLKLLLECDFPCDVVESSVIMDGTLTHTHPGRH